MEALWSTTTQDSTVSCETTVCVRSNFFLKGAREDFRRAPTCLRKKTGRGAAGRVGKDRGSARAFASLVPHKMMVELL